VPTLSDLFARQKCLIPYFTFGDPSISFTTDLVLASFDAGADIVEIGLPYSDPLADGPVIQASHQRALAAYPNFSLDMVFEWLVSIRKYTDKPIIFMSAANLIEQYGPSVFFLKGSTQGMGGLLVPDLPFEESADYLAAAAKTKIPLVFLVSPFCDPSRLRQVVSHTKGFVYLISSAGTTGMQARVSENLAQLVTAIKVIKKVPVVVGFGIHTEERVREMAKIADGVVVGSYFTSIIAKNPDDQGIKKTVIEIRRFKQALLD